MSLVKIASAASILSGTASGLGWMTKAIPMWPGLTGKPGTWLFRKVNTRLNPFVFGGRKWQQKNLLAGAAHAISEVRDKGRVVDATKRSASFLEGMMGHPVQTNLIKFQEFRDSLTPNKKALFDEVSRAFVSESGHINRYNVEKALTLTKRTHDFTNYVGKSHLPVYTGVGTGLVTGSLAGSKTRDPKKRTRNALKGFVTGAVAGIGGGYAVKNKAKHLADKFKGIQDIHKAYFADKYWADTIDKANKLRSGSLFGKLFTTPLQNRVKRIKVRNALGEAMDHPMHFKTLKQDVKTLKDKFTNFKNLLLTPRSKFKNEPNIY